MSYTLGYQPILSHIVYTNSKGIPKIISIRFNWWSCNRIVIGWRKIKKNDGLRFVPEKSNTRAQVHPFTVKLPMCTTMCNLCWTKNQSVEAIASKIII